MLGNVLPPNDLLKVKSIGIPGYITPKCGLKPRLDCNTKISKSKYKNFVSEYTKSRDFVPPPNKYKLSRSLIIKNKKMYFGKGTRTTMTADIIKNAKKNKLGPGQYTIKDTRKIKGVCKSSCRKSVGFLDEAEYKAKNTPSYYNAKLVRAKVLTPDFKRQSRERDTKLKKKKGLAPNSYDYNDSFYKTQVVSRK